jgi:hypothetical protein
MLERCGQVVLTTGSHVVYIEGFQAGGGVGMVATYSGPDTGEDKLLIRSGYVMKNSRYFPQCQPFSQKDPSKFTICMFRSEIFLPSMPRIRDANKGTKRLYFEGKGHLPVVDMHSLYGFRQYVANTPDVNYAWVIYGQLQIGNPGIYNLCISSDDG